MSANTRTRFPLLFGLVMAITWFGLVLPASAAEPFEMSGTVIAIHDGLLEIELDDGRRVLAQPPVSAEAPQMGEHITATVEPVADIYQVIEFQPEPQY